MRTHKIAVIPGDGIGIEVINEGIRVYRCWRIGWAIFN